MKNIHILPTDKRSKLANRDSNNKLEVSEKNTFFVNGFGFTPQNIYITSYEEIKEGVDQWYLDKVLNEPYNSGGAQYSSKQNVIILTTDQDLIKDGVQKIDDVFLEWFVNNPSCEKVEVLKCPIEGLYALIPKEEPKQLFTEDFGLPQFGTKEFNDLASQCFGGKPKQETLEQDAELEKLAMDKLKSKWEHLYTFGYPQKPFPTNYENDLNNVKVGLYEGAKWQSERMYSEEEVLQLLLRLQQTESYDNLYDWFEQFKKK